jgi:hypothetical protein
MTMRIELRYDIEALGDIPAADYERAVVARLGAEWPGCEVDIAPASLLTTRVWVEGESEPNADTERRALALQQQAWEELCEAAPQ